MNRPWWHLTPEAVERLDCIDADGDDQIHPHWDDRVWQAVQHDR